jgi:hypothetical protein
MSTHNLHIFTSTRSCTYIFVRCNGSGYFLTPHMASHSIQVLTSHFFFFFPCDMLNIRPIFQCCSHAHAGESVGRELFKGHHLVIVSLHRPGDNLQVKLGSPTNGAMFWFCASVSRSSCKFYLILTQVYSLRFLPETLGAIGGDASVPAGYAHRRYHIFS